MIIDSSLNQSTAPHPHPLFSLLSHSFQDLTSPLIFILVLGPPNLSDQPLLAQYFRSSPIDPSQQLGDMRSDYIRFSASGRLGKGKPPSLVDLCVQVAIDNIRYIGDVGETDIHLLERILPHCTLEQLMHIENATADRDLTPVTDKLWKKFFEAEFGAHWLEKVVKRMEENGVTFKWRQLYQARLKEVEEKRNSTVERLAQSYKDQNARKQSRQIKICTKAPPSTKKRSFCGAFGASSSFSNLKSNLMKKAKIEYSAEIKNRVAVKRVVVQMQRTNSVMMRPPNTHGKATSNSKYTK